LDGLALERRRSERMLALFTAVALLIAIAGLVVALLRA
jgi:hypothetical protein